MNIYLFLFQGEPTGGFPYSTLVMFAVIAAIFYFLVLLPQKKQKQKLQDMIAGLKINDEVVTNGGIIGRIKEVKDTSFIIQSAEKSFLEVGKSAVVGKKPE